MKSVFSLMIVVALIVGCEQTTPKADVVEKTESSPATATPTNKAATTNGNYSFEAIPGSEMQMATRHDENGFVLETGPMIDGVKTGTWQENHLKSPYPAKVVSYVNGKYNGLYLEINDRGQIEQMAHYKDNDLHGTWAKMRFGKAEFSATYNEGEIDGFYREFDFRNGKIKKEVSFKNGKEDGTMKFFDEEGNVTVEYIYRDGEKISGGIVDK